jgi:proteasome lid subunit RPN8/RPN11
MRVLAFDVELPAPSSRPDAPVRLRLAPGVLAATQQALHVGSAGVREAIVLWAGRSAGEHAAVVSHLILPVFHSRRNFLTIPQAERLEVAAYLRAEELLVFADLHTHPEEAFLSSADEARPFSRKDGFYAVVIPDFAAGHPGAGWRFFQSRSGRWSEVAPTEVLDVRHV